MDTKDAHVKSSDTEKKAVTVFQHPDVPFLKISINSSCRPMRVSQDCSDERERGGSRVTQRTSLRRPTPTAPPGGRSLKLVPPNRDARTARSLSPARNKPDLPSGRPQQPDEIPAPKPKRSFIDTGSAKLFEKAADLKSSLDAPQYRMSSVRDNCQESVSLPSSPMNSRKIGLSYMTPPTSRKLGSSVSPVIQPKHDKENKVNESVPPLKLAQNLMRPESRSSAPIQPISTPFTFHLLGPDQPSSSPNSRSSSPGPFTSMLKSGSRSSSPAPAGRLPQQATPVAERISRFDTVSRRDQLAPAPGDSAARGVSPTPLGNLRLASARPQTDNSGETPPW